MGMRLPLRMMKMFCSQIVGVIAQHRDFTKCHGIVLFEMGEIVCILPQ